MIQKSKVHRNPGATPPPFSRPLSPRNSRPLRRIPATPSQPLPLATPRPPDESAATPSQYFPYELLDRMRQPDLHDPAPLTHAEQRLVESGRPADHPPIRKPEPRLMPRAGDHTPLELPLLERTPRVSAHRPHRVKQPPLPNDQHRQPLRLDPPHLPL